MHQVKNPKKYGWVGIFLFLLTFLTVGANHLNVGVALAILMALLIATLKGSLVASFFMHLFAERKVITILFLSTLFLFIGMMALILVGQFNVYEGLKHVP